jgi:hypothetical protein
VKYEFTNALNTLTRLLAEGSYPPDRDDVAVYRLPPVGSPLLYLVTLRGAAKAQLDGLLCLITGREERRSVGVWALDRGEVERLMMAVQAISRA